MSSMKRIGVGVVGRRLVFAIALIAFASCAEKTPPPKTPAAAAPAAPAGPPPGPPVELWPSAKGRPVLLATISLSSFDRLLSNGARLVGQAVPLPMDAAGLRDMLLAQAGLSPAVSENLDFASPSGAAVVAVDAAGKSGTVVAVAARGEVEAQKIIDSIGRKVLQRGPVALVEAGAQGRGWLYRAGRSVVLSDDLEALVRGASLALEAQVANPDDVTATIFPEALARTRGTDVRSAMARFVKEARTAQEQAGQNALGDQGFEVMAEMLEMVGDADRIELVLTADPARGAILRARMVARPGTKLEALARDVRPFELDPAVAAGTGPRFALGATSLGPFWRGVLSTYRDRLAAEKDKDKGAQRALDFYEAYLAETAGQQSGAVWLSRDVPHLSAALSTSFKDAAGGAKVAATVAKLDTAAMRAIVRVQMGAPELFEVTAKRETVGKLKAVRARFKLKNTKALEAEGVRRMVGPAFDMYWAASGNRLFVTFGRDARARLTTLATAKVPPPEAAGPFAEARNAAKGRDGFYYFDFAPVLSVVGELATEPRVAALARAGSGPIPIVMTSGGDGAGKAWTIEATITTTAFTSIGTLIAGGMGMAK